jgi:superfamily II DNA or RNA helicase
LKLRPYQKDALEAITTKFAEGVTGQVVQAATGLGKTVLFASLPDALNFADDDWMLVLAHTDELAKQAADKIQRCNPDRTVGVEMGGSKASGAQLVVGSPQTLGRANTNRLKVLTDGRKPPRAIVSDECHRSLGQTYLNVYNHFDVPNNKEILHLGVTATTRRTDGKSLHIAGFEEIVYKYLMIDGIRDGWLCGLKGLRVDTETALDGVHTKGGDFDQVELAGTVNTKLRNAIAAQAWLDHASGRPTVGFTVDIQHAKDAAAAFRQRLISAEAIWGDDPDRSSKLKRHRDGDITVLLNAQLLVEGYDDWRVACIMWLRPTQSELVYVQGTGRGTRIPEGIENLNAAKQMGLWLPKEDCLVIDLVDNSSKHSLMTLASLHGLNYKADLKGRPITDVVEEIEEIKRQCPTIDTSSHLSIEGLRAYAESVDLFQPKETPVEVASLSKFRWTHVDGGYVLMLQGKDHICAVTDMLGRWHIVGQINGNSVQRDVSWELADAIQEADYQVQLHGGRQLQSLVKRAAKWHDLEPTDGQLLMCKYHGIRVPSETLPDGTKQYLVNRGQVHNAISEALERKKQARLDKGKKIA